MLSDCKVAQLGFELRLPVSFAVTIAVTLSTPPYIPPCVHARGSFAVLIFLNYNQVFRV